LSSLVVFALASEADVLALKQGITKIEKPEWSGILVVWGEQAFPVLTVKSDWEVHFASVAAANYGKGRVVAMGYPSKDKEPIQGTVTLHDNVLKWASKNKSNPRIAVIGGDANPKLVPGATRLKGVGSLNNFDVVYIAGDEIGKPGDLDHIRQFVKNGGGLVVCVLGYQYAWDHPGFAFTTAYQPNQLLIPMGLAYTDNNGYELDANLPQDREAAYAPAQLKKLIELSSSKGELKKPEVMQANGIVTDTCRYAPLDSSFAKNLKSAIQATGEVLITPKQPLTWKEPMKRLAVIVRANEVRRLPADQIKADPCGDVFPGKVPSDAIRSSEKITIQVDLAQWASTGVYVPAGEVATVKVPKELADKGVVAQIGCHNSPIVICESWERHPMLVMSWPIKEETTKIASPYGGLLYFVIPEGIKLPRQTIEVNHVVKAPRYVRGETPLYEWQTKVRNYLAPTAEFASSRITLTVPSDIARKIDNPEELMQLWDRIMDLYVDLGMRQLPTRGERVVSDQQIAYGYMYAGYPIMTFLDAADFGTDVKFLTEKGSWGHWHELGHNQQQTDWTFEGTGEVTENLFSLIVMEKVANQPVKDWLAKQMPAAKKHIEAGAPFETWKSEPFLALTMYAQIQQAFGWEPYYKVFAIYRDLPEKDRPKNDDEKRDQWMVRMSRVLGRNLGPFFQAWGVPTTQAARDSIKDLPSWMPSDMPKNPKG
jgi:hypothetical protein